MIDPVIAYFISSMAAQAGAIRHTAVPLLPPVNDALHPYGRCRALYTVDSTCLCSHVAGDVGHD